MSGAEAMTILGIISSVISIVDGTKQVYDAASNTNGLPEAFREVAARLPIVRDILDSAKRHFREEDTNEESCKAAKKVVEKCQSKAQNLEDIFKKVIPADDASRAERYFSAVRSVGKGNRVETLMKGMLEDLQLLAINHGMVTETKAREKELAKVIKYVTGPRDQALACLQALFQALQTDPRDDRNELIQRKETRVEHTCTWITSNQYYKSWLDSCPQLLWLSGGPGKGKTMMSIFLAESLEQFTKDSPDAVSLEFFCDSKNNKRNTADNIIQGLVFQLLHKKKELIKHVLPTFAIQQASLFSGSSFESLWRIFAEMTCDPILRTIYCVLDGLDECDEASLKDLLGHFKALFSNNTSGTGSSHLNLIAVSRDRPDIIRQLLSGFPRIQLDLDADAEINKDITCFIDAKLDSIFSDKKYPQSTQEKVKDIFRKRAQGTFLWIGIAAKTLEEYDAIEFEKALERLPPGLDELYARILLGIKVNHRQIAARILRWVVMAIRPLTLLELSAVIEPNIEPPPGFTREDVTRTQVSYCGCFLMVKGSEVNLIHQSAKDYLLQKDRNSNPELRDFYIEVKAGNHEIAGKCLQCLEDNLLASGGIDLEGNISHLEAFPFLSYAIRYWHVYARSLPRSDDVFDLSRTFYDYKSPIRDVWLETYCELEDDKCDFNSSNLLHIASRFGILPLAEKLLTPGGFLNKRKRLRSIDQTDGMDWTALHWATSEGHLAIVRLLVEKGADINAGEGDESTVLQCAADSGHKGIVRLLLEKGADIDAKDRLGETALHRAAKFGHEEIIHLLLEMGADIHAKDQDGITALHSAADFGNLVYAQSLFAARGDITAKDGLGETALSSAAGFGYEGTIRILVEKGADINAKGANGKTALHRAAHFRHEGVVRSLLESGADINAKDEYGMTALHSATRYSEKGNVRLLVEMGADINAKDEDGITVLHMAARSGHKEVVRLLLEMGADINVEDNLGKIALDFAFVKGYKGVVELLTQDEWCK